MIELTTSLLMLASAFTGGGNGGAGTTTQGISSDLPLATVSTEAYVRDYFKDTPLLAEIARCESTFKQFDRNGNVIRGKVNSDDIGVMQINTYYHGESAEKLGYDIYTIDGNLSYAKHLYEKYGDDPWSSSSKCWKKHKQENKEIAKK
jgi:hypothetical protein